MMRRRIAGLLFVGSACLGVLPTAVHAQSAIAGLVTDTSGAVLPGVTVEASSDVLIEKVRTVVTDGQGQYRIVDLRPGVYVVTFALTGFQTFRREGVELPTDFIAAINAEMKVGALEETVTVSGASPVVDVQSAVHTQVLSRETVDQLPTGRTIQSVGQLVVGISLSLPDVAGSRAMQQTYMSTHGMTAANNTYQVDGMPMSSNQGPQITAYFDEAMNQEISYQTSGVGADVSGGGVRMNMIPKEGGNTFSGSFYSAIRPGAWQTDNLTQRLIGGGLRAVGKIDQIYQVSGTEGGPLKKNSLWFFTAARFYRVDTPIADTFYKDGRQGIDDQYLRTALLRLTWQVSPRNKFALYYDRQDKFRGHDMTAGTDPDTASMRWGFPLVYTSQAKWTSTVTNKLLIEGGYSNYMPFYTIFYQPGISKPPFSPEWYATASRVDLDLVTRTTAGGVESDNRPERYNFQASASYVTGSHNLKTGFQSSFGTYRLGNLANADLEQRYRRGVPDSVLVRNTPLNIETRLNADVGLYVQDSWKVKRLTVNAGLRWEYLNAQVSEQDAPAGRFVPARHVDRIPNLPNWKDWAPRFSMVYDLFGNAKTAVKYMLNRYNDAVTIGIAGNYNPLASATAALRWQDLNRDDIAQGDRGCVYLTPGCEIDFSTLPANFGTRSLNTYGNYPRSWNLEHGLELQHELLPRLSLSGAWFHGNYHNLRTTVNTLRTHADYTRLTIFNPMDGTPITVHNLNPAKASAVANLDTFDPERRQTYNNYSVEFKGRPGRGAQVFGGLAVERSLRVSCTAPDDPNSLRFCDQRDSKIPYQKQFKLAGSYPLPWGVTLGGVFQSNPGTVTSGGITYAITRSTRYPADCPAPCPAGALVIGPQLTQSSLTVSLVPEGTVFTERINQLDLKFSKTFRMHQVSLEPTFEVFNAFNSDAINTYRSVSYATPSFMQPSLVLQGRIVGVGFQVQW